MKPSYLVLLAENVTTAISFWRDTMRLPLTYSDETIGYAAFDTGYAGFTLSIFNRKGLIELLGESALAGMGTGAQMYLSFPVDDVDVTYMELLERGAKPLAPPQDRPEQQSRLAHISSPDGHIIEIYSPMR